MELKEMPRVCELCGVADDDVGPLVYNQVSKDVLDKIPQVPINLEPGEYVSNAHQTCLQNFLDELKKV